MLCLQLKPTVIRKKKSILLGSYGSPDSDGAMQGQILQLAKVRYERGAEVGNFVGSVQSSLKSDYRNSVSVTIRPSVQQTPVPGK